MPKEACKATVRRLWDEAFNQGNMALMDEICHARHVTHDPGVPEVPHGPDGLRQVLATYRRALDGAQVQLEDLFGQEGKAVARWAADATAARAGRALTGLSVFRFEGDQIIETWSRCEALMLTTSLEPLVS